MKRAELLDALGCSVGSLSRAVTRLRTAGLLEVMQGPGNINRYLLTDIPAIYYETDTPERTDRHAEADGPRMSRAEMYQYLLAQRGPKCQGCDRTFDDPRYLELDHNTPRSDGGLNHITNRVLLCGPCNRAKSTDTYTLSGLRRLNRANGWMVKP